MDIELLYYFVLFIKERNENYKIMLEFYQFVIILSDIDWLNYVKTIL